MRCTAPSPQVARVVALRENPLTRSPYEGAAAGSGIAPICCMKPSTSQ